MDEQKFLSVYEINRIIKMKFENSSFFNKVYIKGEISNFKKQFPSNHCYFTIKDEQSRISAVMFNQKASKLNFEPKDGDKVFVVGKISVYEPNGNYQLFVEEMNSDGAGELYKKFLELKDQLLKEGIFDQKRQIPKFPKKIGIITASTGAAVKDILNTINRRYPLCETLLFPSLVQGIEASKSISKQIKKAQDFDLDLLIIGRGGGSIEDLWPFNEKEVAYAIYESKIPTISAVGHQVDFTISDFVADLRAATPTAAAELAVPNISDISINIDNNVFRLNNLIFNKLQKSKELIKKFKNNYILKNPIRIYEMKRNNIENNIEKVNSLIQKLISDKLYKLNIIKENYVLKNPENIYINKNSLLEKYINKIELLNPLNALKRGYSILKKDNKSVNSVNKICTGDNIDIRLTDGVVNAIVQNIKEEI